MTKSARQAVARHRKRLEQRGIVRVEVRVPKQHAKTMRALAQALADPVRATQVRAFVLDKLGKRRSLIEMLQAMPDGIDFDNLRIRDYPRDVDL
jgi:RNA-binding protein YhbY